MSALHRQGPFSYVSLANLSCFRNKAIEQDGVTCLSGTDSSFQFARPIFTVLFGTGSEQAPFCFGLNPGL
jgi:hypothetical protein